MDPRATLRKSLDRRLGDASTLVVCLPAYALAIAAAAWAASLAPHPILGALSGMIAGTLAIYAVVLLFGNASIYDPFWSVAPPAILALYLTAEAAPGEGTTRIWLVTALVLAWAVRLTWNCLDRWRRLSGEDFRYRDLRRKTGRWFWLVNLTGIEMFPTLLVFAGCLPLYPVAISDAPLGWLDGLGLALALFAIGIETAADRQLRVHLRAPGAEGVLTSGVWGWSQHPNYLGEISFWWALLVFGLAAGAPWWMALGALAMTALFWFISIPMMLERKRARHPGYDDAVKGIPVLLPRPPRP